MIVEKLREQLFKGKVFLMKRYNKITAIFFFSEVPLFIRE